MQPPRDPSTAPNTVQKRPITPGKTSPFKENNPPGLDIPLSKKDEKKEKRSSLAFLRRSKSSDRGNLRPLVPNIPQIAPKIPDLWNGSTPPQPLRTFGGPEIRDSVAIVGGLDIPGMSPGRRSIDTGFSGSSSAHEPGKSSGKDSAGEEASLNAVASMAHRGRYSFASAGSTVNSPRRVRRRKDPTPFNILVIGARNSGKTSFIQFLQQSLAVKPSKNDPPMEPTPEEAPVPSKSTFIKTYLETEIDGERIGLTLWDSQGFEKNIVDLQLRETIAFIESKFEESFTEETKVVRAPGVRDTHIHCAFHLIDPARLESSIIRATTSNSSANGNILSGGLDDDLDLQVLKGLRGKTTVVPVISKADTITSAHMNVLKHLVRTSLKSQGLDPLEALEIDLEAYGITPSPIPPNMYTASPEPKEQTNGGRSAEENTEDGIIDEDEEEGDDERTPTRRRAVSRASLETTSTSATENPMTNVEFLPLSVISPDSYEPGAIGRKFPWGFADPFNAEHCDFLRLKEAVFNEWRGELRESSREIWYENWRTSRLSGPGGIMNGAVRKNGAKRR
ncbi:hypothetical protein L211DRAFT_856249 [Terfezia boudieri ATCC MYA-4762]|uniref:Septin-type G domain-containing protein n=1 Tax=Terfezia boudieri ATCC MYA-4762 TaxID=1051890 RepID=A0A3N4MA38_9PEZI|nr:hypothetical protein L211DRAFT_856249 [Terfezia boudieri ATCC MYA-4762]